MRELVPLIAEGHSSRESATWDGVDVIGRVSLSVLQAEAGQEALLTDFVVQVATEGHRSPGLCENVFECLVLIEGH